MANGAFKFKDNSGNVVASIGSNGSNIVITGGTLDLSGMSGLTLGSVTLSGTTQNATSASHAASYLLTSSFNTYSGTTNTVIGTLQTSTGSLNSFTSSTNTRLNSIEGVSGSYATTGSNQFKSDQAITGSLTVTGYIEAQELRTTYISSSILFRSGSTKFGDELSDTHAFTGSLLVSGNISVPGSGLISGSAQILNGSGIWSGSAQLPSGVVSGSVQVDIMSTTNIARLATTGSNTFSATITATGNASTTPSFIANNPTGNSGTAQHYADFTAGATVLGRLLRGNGASGLEANGLNIDNFAGFKVRLNQLGGSGGFFTVEGGNVGIGITNPTNSRLLVAGTHVSGNSILGIVPVGNQTATIGLYNSSNVRRGLLYSDTGFVRLETDADPLQLLSAGNLGLTIGTTGTATFASSVTATSFEVGNGQFFKARRSSSNLLIDLLGIESGTDNTRLLITGDFNIKNGSLSTLLNMTTAGAISLGANATGDSNPYSLTILRNGTLASPGTWLSTPAIKVEDISGDGPSSVTNTTALVQLNLGRIADNDTFANNAFFINCVNDNGSAFVVTGKRNVGIGINTPAAPLTVRSTGATGILLEQDGSNSAVSSRLVARNNTVTGTIRYDNGGWRFNTNATIDATSGTERALISTDGYFRMLSGTGGVQFGGNTASSNALNAYEEGTWTPSILGATGESTYPGNRSGWYTRVGRLVTVTWFVTITKNNMTGTLRMSGLPFTLMSGGGLFYPQGTVLLDGLGTATNNITFQGAQNSSSGDFIGGNGSTATHTGLPVSVLGSGTMECRGTLTYFT